MADVTLVNAVFPSPVTAPPLGLLYIASSLERAGYDVEIRDYQLCEAVGATLPDTLAEFSDDDSPILGFSAMSYALPLLIEAARRLKERASDRYIVVGGIGPSGVAQRLLSFCPDIDVVVLGEGEETMVELVQCLLHGRDLAQVRGIVYRGGDSVVSTGPRARIQSLSDLPRPAYSHVALKKYRIVDIQFGRGCPFSCSFCDIAPYWTRKHTARSIEEFLDDLESLHSNFGVEDVFFVDDTFVLRRSIVEQICDGIRERGLNISWGCYARTDLVSRPLLEKMASAGCKKVFYGIESGSARILSSIDKRIDLQRTRDAVKASVEHMPFVTTSFVWGFPSESFEDFVETVMLLLYFTSLGASPQFNLVLPYSYSTLFNAYRSGITFDTERSSQLQFYGEYLDAAALLIRADSELFSAFYQLPTPEFDRKWQFLEDLGMSPVNLQKAYFDVLH